MEREIIHLNVTDFAVAVERQRDPGLKNRPLIIGLSGAARATVYDMSDEAYRDGVRKGMALVRARRLCRGAEVVAPHPECYGRALQALWQRALPFSPLIEIPDQQGHLFLEMTGSRRLFGAPAEVAWRIRKTVVKELGFDPVWSVASNKLVAKVANRVVRPAGEYVVEAGQEAGFLAPLDLALLPGLQSGELARFQEFNLRRVEQVTPLSLPQLAVPFAGRARFLFDAVRGIDSTPVWPVGTPLPRVAFDHEFAGGVADKARVEGVLFQLAAKSGRQLRQRQRTSGRVGLRLEYCDGGEAIRQATPPTATANDFELYALALLALKRAWQRRVGLRRLSLICDRLAGNNRTLSLFAAENAGRQKSEALLTALDRVRQRWGEETIRHGREMR